MKINLKSAALASFVGALLGGVSYGADVEVEKSGAEVARSRTSIAECFSPEARAAINRSSEVFRSHGSSLEGKALDIKKQELVASLLALQQQLPLVGQHPIESDWLMLQINALKEMIKVYEDNYSSPDEREDAIGAVLHPALQEQWALTQERILSSQLRDCLHELHLINLEKRTLEDHPEKANRRLALLARMITAGEKFLKWLDDKSNQDELAQAELKALDELGILPPQTIESLRGIVARLKEKPDRA